MTAVFDDAVLMHLSFEIRPCCCGKPHIMLPLLVYPEPNNAHIMCVIFRYHARTRQQPTMPAGLLLPHWGIICKQCFTVVAG